MKVILALFLLIHGFAHLVGFIVPWKLAVLKEMPYDTRVFYKKLNLSPYGIRIIGIFWLVTALAYYYCIFELFNNPAMGMWLIWLVSVFSLILSTLALPETKFGILANVILIILLVAIQYFGLIS